LLIIKWFKRQKRNEEPFFSLDFFQGSENKTLQELYQQSMG